MKPVVKKTIIIGSLIIGAVFAFSAQKYNDLKRVFEQLTMKPKNIRDLKVSLSNISFVTDLLFTNPTNEAFDVSGYIATLTRLNFFYNGKYVATAKPTITDVNIPAKNQLEINNIPVVIPAQSVLDNLQEIMSFDVNNLSVEAVIEVAGKEFYIK